MEFTYYYDDIKCDNNEWLLFNIFSGTVISVPDKIHKNISEGRIEDIAEEEKELLIQQGFIVDSHDEEVDKVTNKLLNMKYKNDSLVITVLTNMDCNLGCRYCHENGFLSQAFLTESQINKINTWITSQVRTGQYKKVTIYFYGGEPTLNMHAIEAIAKHVQSLSNEYDFKYNFSMSTNATLLNDSMVDRLVNAHVIDLQVTLDGPEDIHDFRKPFLDGRGTFKIILDNIKKYNDKIHFTVRANVDKNNYDHIPELMDIIVENHLQNKVYFYLDLISSTHSMNEYCSNNVFTSIGEMASITYLWEEQKKRGIPLHGKNVIEGLCGNLSKSNVTISASGEFYICPGLCGIEEACLGNLDAGYNSVFERMMQTNVWENCKRCPYLPMCAGGCRAQAYMKSGSCFSCYCKKRYYESVVMQYIRCKYA